MTTDRRLDSKRAETIQRLSVTRAKIEHIVESSNDENQKVAGLVGLGLIDLFSDFSDRLHDIGEQQGVQNELAVNQSNALKDHIKSEDVMLGKLKGAVAAFTALGGGLAAFIVWAALELTSDVQTNTESILRLSTDVAVNSERLRALPLRYPPKSGNP